MEDQGDLSDYLGVNIERRKDGKIEMTQPTLTLFILRDVGLWENGKKNQAIGGIKAVIWTDLYQVLIMFSNLKFYQRNVKEYLWFHNNYESFLVCQNPTPR